MKVRIGRAFLLLSDPLVVVGDFGEKCWAYGFLSALKLDSPIRYQATFNLQTRGSPRTAQRGKRGDGVMQTNMEMDRHCSGKEDNTVEFRRPHS